MRTKALQCVRPHASFTVEAAFVVPLLVFAVAAFLGFFQMLEAETEVAQGLQYASRTLAASCCGEDDSVVSRGVMLARGSVLFRKYLKEQGCEGEMIKGGWAGVSFAGSDLSGEYVSLCASYRVCLPVSFWRIRDLRVSQCVSSRKWIGAVSGDEDAGADDSYVYVTERGTAYHSSTACHYLDLSVRCVPADRVKALRNKNGSIYRRCGCCRSGQTDYYVTDYGTQYHGSLSCGDLKRTVYRVKKEQAGGRHPCPKCCGGSE